MSDILDEDSPTVKNTTEAEGPKLRHGKSWECTETFMQSPLGPRAGAGCGHTDAYAQEGPPGGTLAGGLLQPSLAQRPLRGVSAWGGVLGLLNTRFFRRNWPREGQVIFF